MGMKVINKIFLVLIFFFSFQVSAESIRVLCDNYTFEDKSTNVIEKYPKDHRKQFFDINLEKKIFKLYSGTEGDDFDDYTDYKITEVSEDYIIAEINYSDRTETIKFHRNWGRLILHEDNKNKADRIFTFDCKKAEKIL